MIDDDPGGDLRVAITHASGRVDKVAAPLRASSMELSVSPDAPREHDVILLDMPGKSMLTELLRRDDTPVVYRIRGNLWRAAQYWTLGKLKSELSDRVLFPALDAAVPADQYLETEFRNRSGNTATSAIGLPIRPTEWPTVSHTDRDLRLLTLTNADYLGKVEPIIGCVGLVNETLAKTGGTWTIGGDGRFADRLASATAGMEHVSYEGFIDASGALADANVLFHPSEFDIQTPNAILEGMASHLPVVTSAYPPFVAHERYLSPRSDDALVETLRDLRKPTRRRLEGDRNVQYVREQHSPATIGQQYRRFFEAL